MRQAFQRRDVDLAQDLVRQDDEIDRLNRDVFHLALEIGDDADTREWAMHMMLVARCIERIGDNAVDIGEQTASSSPVCSGSSRTPRTPLRRPPLDLRLHRHRQQHHPAAGGGCR